SRPDTRLSRAEWLRKKHYGKDAYRADRALQRADSIRWGESRRRHSIFRTHPGLRSGGAAGIFPLDRAGVSASGGTTPLHSAPAVGTDDRRFHQSVLAA